MHQQPTRIQREKERQANISTPELNIKTNSEMCEIVSLDASLFFVWLFEYEIIRTQADIIIISSRNATKISSFDVGCLLRFSVFFCGSILMHKAYKASKTNASQAHSIDEKEWRTKNEKKATNEREFFEQKQQLRDYDLDLANGADKRLSTRTIFENESATWWLVRVILFN